MRTGPGKKPLFIIRGSGQWSSMLRDSSGPGVTDRGHLGSDDCRQHLALSWGSRGSFQSGGDGIILDLFTNTFQGSQVGDTQSCSYSVGATKKQAFGLMTFLLCILFVKIHFAGEEGYLRRE